MLELAFVENVRVWLTSPADVPVGVLPVIKGDAGGDVELGLQPARTTMAARNMEIKVRDSLLQFWHRIIELIVASS